MSQDLFNVSVFFSVNWTNKLRILNSDAMKTLRHKRWADFSLQLNWIKYCIIFLATDDRGLMSEDTFCSLSMPTFFVPQGVSSAWGESFLSYLAISLPPHILPPPSLPEPLHHSSSHCLHSQLLNDEHANKKQKYVTLLHMEWERRQFYTHESTFLFCFEWKVCI